MTLRPSRLRPSALRASTLRGGTARAVVPLLAAAALLTGCASTGAHQPPAPLPAPDPPAAPAAAHQASGAPAQLPEATTFATIPGAPVDTDRTRPSDGVVLNVKRETTVHTGPGGAPFARLPASELHGPTWVPVVEHRGDWARVLLPSRPNGSTGWVRTGDEDAVSEAATPYEVDVDVPARRLVVRENGAEVGSWTVGVGARRTPTPRGRTFVMASIRETVTHFSPVILPLGAHSETLNTYGGGPGTVALHGWPDPGVFGTASSDGCVRVPDDALRVLQQLPLGTLVLVR